LNSPSTLPPSVSGGRRARILAVGYSFVIVTDHIFDYVLYPLAIWKAGAVIGGIFMSILDLTWCFLLFLVYDRLKSDWLGIEWLKQVKQYDGIARFKRVLKWMLMRGDVVAFIVLSVKYDPFITTAYLRRGTYNGFESRDWQIFLGSWALSNLFWILFLAGGIEVVKAALWNFGIFKI